MILGRFARKIGVRDRPYTRYPPGLQTIPDGLRKSTTSSVFIVRDQVLV